MTKEAQYFREQMKIAGVIPSRVPEPGFVALQSKVIGTLTYAAARAEKGGVPQHSADLTAKKRLWDAEVCWLTAKHQ